MIVYKFYYEDKMTDKLKVGFYIGVDMADAALQHYVEHPEGSKYRLMKIEYVGTAENPPIKTKE